MKKLALLLLAFALMAPAFGAEDKTETWLDRVDFKGDLRLRYEGFDQDNRFDDGRRDRFRLRLRVGMTTQVNDMIKLGFELRSGNPDDPVSDNQSLDGGLSKMDIAIAQAYADFALHESVNLIAGKFAPKKLWTVSDMHWDDDVVVEGAMMRFRQDIWAANAYVFVLEESSSGDDAYYYGVQAGPTIKSGKNTFKVGVGYETIDEAQAVVDLTLEGDLDGNNVTNILDENDMLVSDFDILSAFVEWKHKGNDRWPITVKGFFYNNTGAEGAGEDHDTAYFARFQIGDYKKPGQMAFRFSRYYSEPDALFYAWTQSDTTRSSNVDGFRFDWRVGLPSKGYINVTWYNTDFEVGESDTMNRWQVDYILKF